MVNFSKKVLESEQPQWVTKRCPHCNAILFEKDPKTYKIGSVRFKCRRCKEIMIV